MSSPQRHSQDKSCPALHPGAGEDAELRQGAVGLALVWTQSRARALGSASIHCSELRQVAAVNQSAAAPDNRREGYPGKTRGMGSERAQDLSKQLLMGGGMEERQRLGESISLEMGEADEE